MEPEPTVPAVAAGQAGPRCPVCATGFEGRIRRCERCSTPHHGDCWDYAGGCAVFGCASRGIAPLAPPERVSIDRLVMGWYWCVQGMRASVLAIFAPVGAGFLLSFLAALPGLGRLVAALPLGFLSELAGLLVLVGMVVGTALVVPTVLLRTLVDWKLGGALRGRGSRAVELARRMDGIDGLWTRIAAARSWVGTAIAGAAALSLLLGLLGSGGLAAVPMVVVLPALIAYAVLDAFHDSAIEIASVQNRLVASTKTLPPAGGARPEAPNSL